MKPEEADKFFAILKGPDPFGCLDVTYCNPQWVKEPQSMPDLISKALRAYIKAEDGKLLYVSDFSNIETRNLAWVAGCRLLNEAFATGQCPYRQFASRVYNVRPDDIAKGSQERQLGKAAVLGLGYAMGYVRFQETAAAHPYWITLPEDRAKEIVKLYRETYPEVPDFWRTCEEAFTTAIRKKTQIQAGKVAFGCNGNWGWIVLPSQRPIWMHEPKIERVPNRWREGKTCSQISYNGIDPKTKKWVRRTTYGGSLCESICQAIAADLLQAALHRLEANGFPVIMSVHDEVVCEVPESADFDRFHTLMKERPAWAHDLPIECESERSVRYGK
jgi:DNA polymerase